MIVALNANRSNGTWNGVRTAVLADYFYRGGRARDLQHSKHAALTL